MADYYNLLEALLILSIGLAVGWAIGAARLHWSVIEYFRDYYRRQAEARMRQHTRFLVSLINLYGARMTALHSRAVPGVRSWGRVGSLVISQRDQAPGMLHNSMKGGRNAKKVTNHQSNFQ